MANYDINKAPSLQKKYGHYPLQIFSNTEVQPNSKHWIPFGFPVYVLDALLQSGKIINNKWEYFFKNYNIFGPIPKSRTECGSCVRLHHWISINTISRDI